MRLYIQRLFSYKEHTYFTAARRYEQNRSWDQAEMLYRAITNINPSNFEANYRLGIMLITLQKLDDATTFLQKANSLQANDAGVLHHMGIIAFSHGEYQKAIGFFNDALANKGRNPMTSFYIGLSYEELGNFYRAREQYQQAHQQDPNNADIIASIARVDAIINKATRQWERVRHKNQNDEEEGIDIPLPINKTAYDVRMNNLSEEDERKFFADKAENGDDNPINLPEGGIPEGDQPLNGNP